MKRSLVQHPGGDQDRLVEYLQDKLFGHFPRKLRSAKVAVRGCLLVNRPLQVQIPKKNTQGMRHRWWERTVKILIKTIWSHKFLYRVEKTIKVKHVVQWAVSTDCLHVLLWAWSFLFVFGVHGWQSLSVCQNGLYCTLDQPPTFIDYRTLKHLNQNEVIGYAALNN